MLSRRQDKTTVRDHCIDVGQGQVGFPSSCPHPKLCKFMDMKRHSLWLPCYPASVSLSCSSLTHTTTKAYDKKQACKGLKTRLKAGNKDILLCGFYNKIP